MTGKSKRIRGGHGISALFVMEHDRWWTVERNSSGGRNPEILCVTIHRDHALAYYERAKR